MTLRRYLDRLTQAMLATLLAVMTANVADAQVLQLDLDGTLEGRAGDRRILAELGPGATLVDARRQGGVSRPIVRSRTPGRERNRRIPC